MKNTKRLISFNFYTHYRLPNLPIHENLDLLIKLLIYVLYLSVIYYDMNNGYSHFIFIDDINYSYIIFVDIN